MKQTTKHALHLLLVAALCVGITYTHFAIKEHNTLSMLEDELTYVITQENIIDNSLRGQAQDMVDIAAKAIDGEITLAQYNERIDAYNKRQSAINRQLENYEQKTKDFRFINISALHTNETSK